MSAERADTRLTWRAGGLVLLLGVLLTLVAMGRVLWPVLTRPKSHMIGDGTRPQSYGFDLSNLLVSRETLRGGGMPRDGVPVLDEPPRIGVAQVDSLAHQGVAKYLVSSDLVIGVTRGGASSCYPLLALQWHEVVNDTLGGAPIAVVYNPLCDAALVLDRARPDGPPRRFGASGLVWNSNLLLYDRDAESPSLWSALQARAIAGPAAARAESLQVLPSVVLPWKEWRALHPETRVMARKDELVLFDGTLPMLRDLKARNHWLTVATGKSRRGLDDALATAQLHGIFDASRTADETASKPSPQMLFELMREFGADPARALMVGDTTHDLAMARNAGVPSLAVGFGAHDHESFAEFEPLAVVHSTRELHDWLLAHA